MRIYSYVCFFVDDLTFVVVVIVVVVVVVSVNVVHDAVVEAVHFAIVCICIPILVVVSIYNHAVMLLPLGFNCMYFHYGYNY